MIINSFVQQYVALVFAMNSTDSDQRTIFGDSNTLLFIDDSPHDVIDMYLVGGFNKLPKCLGKYSMRAKESLHPQNYCRSKQWTVNGMLTSTDNLSLSLSLLRAMCMQTYIGCVELHMDHILRVTEWKKRGNCATVRWIEQKSPSEVKHSDRIRFEIISPILGSLWHMTSLLFALDVQISISMCNISHQFIKGNIHCVWKIYHTSVSSIQLHLKEEKLKRKFQ